jgi:hypothetical protein
MTRVILLSTTICCLILNIVAPPPRRNEESSTVAVEHGKPGSDKDVSYYLFQLLFINNFQLLNLPYERYLMEVVKTLEKDDSFQKKLSAMTEEEVKVCLCI